LTGIIIWKTHIDQSSTEFLRQNSKKKVIRYVITLSDIQTAWRLSETKITSLWQNYDVICDHSMNQYPFNYWATFIDQSLFIAWSKVANWILFNYLYQLLFFNIFLFLQFETTHSDLRNPVHRHNFHNPNPQYQRQQISLQYEDDLPKWSHSVGDEVVTSLADSIGIANVSLSARQQFVMSTKNHNCWRIQNLIGGKSSKRMRKS
jgi:hypothetical protein